MRATFDRRGSIPGFPFQPIVVRSNGTVHTFGRLAYATEAKAIACAQNWIDGLERDKAIMAAHGYNPRSGGIGGDAPAWAAPRRRS